MKPTKSKRQPFAPVQPATTARQKTARQQPSFLSFVLSAPNRRYLLVGSGIGIIYFLVLRTLFPIASFCSDSFTYLQVAQDKQQVSFRPVEYSHIMNLFKGFSTSEVALVFAQYFSNVLANLLLFFTSTYFLSFRSGMKNLLFGLLLVNPLYVLCSNYILSDAFFGAFTVVWFVALIWMLHRPRWYYTALQVLLLLVLFKLRYHAIVFPVIMMVALYLSGQPWWRQAISLGITVLLLLGLVVNTMNLTEKETNIRTFSAFSGWQMTNNALHVLRFQKADTTMEDEELKKLAVFLNRFQDTATVRFDSVNAHAAYMWHPKSPLKAYMQVYANENGYPNYFFTWTAMGDLYSRFGRHVILHHPGSYLTHFVQPNARAYVFPELEAYNQYFENYDTIPLRVKQFYGYRTDRVGARQEWVYTGLLKPWRYLFPVLNGIFLLVAGTYFFTGRFRKDPPLFRKWLICFLCLYAINFAFIVLLAPTVFRYHVFLLTLIFPLLTYLVQQLTRPTTTVAG